jgi:hypothetical protein
MKKILLYVPFLLLAACGGNDQKADANNPEPEKPTALTQSKNSQEFNSSFDKLLTNYYHLKDALVLSRDTADKLVNPSAAFLKNSADSLKLTELQADESIKETAKSFAQSISAEAETVVSTKNLEEKRKAFQNISDNLFNLVRTVKYDREKVYQQFCPMAFNDAGAFWLSKTSDIKNPYFGPKMLTCGEVKDSLDYSAVK